MDATVIIPVRNAARLLGRQLASLAEQEFDGSFEVVIADNGSTDALAATVEQWRWKIPELRLVDASARLGCGPARNVAVEHAQSQRLLFADADDCVGPRWVGAYVAALDEYALCTGPIALVSEDQLDLHDRMELFSLLEFSKAPALAFGQPVVAGANAAYRAEALQAVGGFDEHNVRAEDVVTSIRATTRGYELGFVEEAKVLYVERSLTSAVFRQRFGWAVGVEVARKQLGFDEPLRSGTLREMLWLCAHGPLFADERTRRAWMAQAGRACGRVYGRHFGDRYFQNLRRRNYRRAAGGS